MKIVFKLGPPPPPPRDYRADEICAAEGLLMLSKSILPPSFSSPSNPSAATESTPATATPPAAVLSVKKTQDCVKKTQDWSLLPPLAPNFPYVCGDAFKSYQALGGHKTRHRSKPTNATVAPPVSDNDRAHVCSICQERFITGQALGGHMRKHFDGMIGGGPSKRVKTSSSSGLAVLEDGDDRSHAISTNNKLLGLDLNLPYTHNFLD